MAAHWSRQKNYTTVKKGLSSCKSLNGVLLYVELHFEPPHRLSFPLSCHGAYITMAPTSNSFRNLSSALHCLLGSKIAVSMTPACVPRFLLDTVHEGRRLIPPPWDLKLSSLCCRRRWRCGCTRMCCLWSWCRSRVLDSAAGGDGRRLTDSMVLLIWIHMERICDRA